MRPSTDPPALSPDVRRRAAARVLAAGLLRLREHDALLTIPADQASPIIPPQSVADGLELGPETRLSVHTG